MSIINSYVSESEILISVARVLPRSNVEFSNLAYFKSVELKSKFENISFRGFLKLMPISFSSETWFIHREEPFQMSSDLV